jgi:hypothetical protein
MPRRQLTTGARAVRPRHLSQETSKRSRAVSMSWWLSTSSERDLHQQTEDTKNENDNSATLELALDDAPCQIRTARKGQTGDDGGNALAACLEQVAIR